MRKTSSPVLIAPDGKCHRLERIFLGAGFKNEDWLQTLVHHNPYLLPIERIEPGFGSPVPAAREVACSHGSIDNLFLTPSGEIILVETKLWRNLQARREVVAQALDYVSALMKLGYEAFEAAILKGVAAASATSLFEIVAGHPEALDEAEFVDAVSRNLSLGRILVIVLGDGIREEVEALASLLQSHAGAHFTFALVELATWKNPSTGDLVVLPGTLAQTVMIERGILRFEGAQPTIDSPAIQGGDKPRTMTEEMFFEELAERDRQLPVIVREFLKMIEPIGIYPEFKASLNLKYELEEATRPLNFGYIRKDGRFRSSPLSWTLPSEIALQYNSRLAELIGGVVATHDGIYVSTNGSSEPLISAFLPDHSGELADAMRSVLKDIRSTELAVES